MDAYQRLEWIAEHVTKIRMLPGDACHIEWVDDEGYTCESRSLSDSEPGCLAALESAIDAALGGTLKRLFGPDRCHA